MNTDNRCPVCENTQQEPITPRLISVGKVKGEVWVCKECAARAVDHIGWAAQLLHTAIDDTVQQRSSSEEEDPDCPF